MATFATTDKRRKYSLFDKFELGKLCYDYKKQYEEEAAALPKRWDSKRKTWNQPKPKEGFLAKAVREAIPQLSRTPNGDKDFQRAKQMAMRALLDYEKRLEDPTFVDEVPKKKQYRQPGAGRKPTIPEVRQAIFEWYVHLLNTLT